MKILIDVNLSPLWVSFLCNAGFDAIHWSSVGSTSAPDSDIMKYASDKQFVILTHDLDFGSMLAVNAFDGPSVVQIRAQDVLPDRIGGTVVQALRVTETQIKRGALVTIDAERHRVRMLPIR
jgi:predicted nuclease of predicted toxin-antitoxin system